LRFQANAIIYRHSSIPFWYCSLLFAMAKMLEMHIDPDELEKTATSMYAVFSLFKPLSITDIAPSV
jgi:hypothetical protein